MNTQAISSSTKTNDMKWEMRPGGMLVQNRSYDNLETPAAVTHDLCVCVCYGTLCFQISINSRATFGELKKLVAGVSGLLPSEQILEFRGKERGNTEFLDRCRVKQRSKILLTEDPLSKERRLIEMRRNARIQFAHRAISDVSVEVDRLANQVGAIEKSIKKGNKVAEVQMTTLVAMLMRQAVKLDAISAQGDASAHKIIQEKRIQKCVETLDVLMVLNARVKPVVVSTKWETFDAPLSAPHWDFLDPRMRSKQHFLRHP